MDFTQRKRFEYALNFKEADRVPIEFYLPDHLIDYPKAQELKELAEEYCGSFRGPDFVNGGFFGVPSKLSKTLKGKDNDYTFTENKHVTDCGEFTQIVQRGRLNVKYCHFKKQFFHEIEELERFAGCEFPDIAIPGGYDNEINEICGDDYVPTIAFHHPFGMLARNSPPEKFYMWLITHSELIHRILEKMYRQINKSIEAINLPYVHYFCALEMAIEPWLSPAMFDEFIFQYDIVMNKKIHECGGLVRHHSHGPVFTHLEHWADMGIDSLEPLEIAPLGDTVLRKAKKLVGDRMSLGGNIPSQRFIELTKDEIEYMTADAIDSCAAGGGFILKGASNVLGLNSFKTLEQLDRIIDSAVHFIKCGLKYGSYT